MGIEKILIIINDTYYLIISQVQNSKTQISRSIGL